MVHTDDQRLIEYGFPCHQVGAETQRERGAIQLSHPCTFCMSGGHADH